MKINFSEYDLSEFLIKDVVFCGIESKLITPNHIGTKFNQKNKIFRSSIWDLDGNLLSASLKKFVNWGENPENFPVPISLDDCVLMDKIDGSTCIVDFVNDQFSARTRGTSSYKSLENSKDFDYCFDNNPRILDWIKNNRHISLLFEITTPNLKIVLDYGDIPQLWLIGAINKNNYELLTQSELDHISDAINVKRPDYYSFESIVDLLHCVENLQDKEGICLYSKNGQEIHKIKALKYLVSHRFKSNANLQNTVDLYFEFNQPIFVDFEKQLIEKFDFECYKMVQNYAKNICDSMIEVNRIIREFKNFSLKMAGLSRKDMASYVIGQYGPQNRSSFVFNIIDGKTLDNDKIKKLLYQVLGEN